MNLNKELKDLFFCLLRESDWVTGDELAEKLKWNRKKVQQNMRWLMEEVGVQCSIESQKNRGYLLFDMSDEFRASVLQDTFYNETYFNLDERRTMLVMALLFQKDYVSMDRLAEDYYLSKTAVFEEIRHLKRWFERIQYLKLEVSPQKGIRVHGTELSMRFSCAVFAQLNILKLLPIDPMILLRYQGILKSCSRILKNAVKKDGLQISGEDFSLILRYIGITYMRSSLGFLLEGEQGNEELIPPDDLVSELSEAAGYSFTASEQEAIVEIIRFSNVIAWESPIETESSRMEQLERYLTDRLQLEGKLFVENRELFGQNIKAMFCRLSHEKHTVNYYDKDILRKYPLATHLVSQGFEDIYGIKLSRSDNLDMAVYLGGILDRLSYPSKIRILLVGNQNFQFLEHIRQYVLKELHCIPACFDLLPCYMLEGSETCSLKEYDLLLTTEPEMLIRHKEFLLIPVAITDSDIRSLKEKIRNWMRRYQQLELEALEENMEVKQLEQLDDLSELLPKAVFEKTTVYALKKDTLVMVYTAPSADTGIQKITLKKRFFYDYKMINQIMIVRFDEAEPGIIEYFKRVSRLLQKQ